MKSDASEWNELIGRARCGDPEAIGQMLETCRGHLRTLARRQLSGRVAVRVDASDVVQQTFLEAHQSFEQFRGQAEPELVAWLEGILGHAVAKTIRRHVMAKKRAVQRERPLDAVESNGSTPRHELDAGHSTPSQRAMRGEDEERLARALETLPEDQREAVHLRHLEGWSLADISRRLGRTSAATAGLIKRGMQALRKQLHPPD
jgi:RNA polymerase sigma-70 factor (ECF subfamily)